MVGGLSGTTAITGGGTGGMALKSDGTVVGLGKQHRRPAGRRHLRDAGHARGRAARGRRRAPRDERLVPRPESRDPEDDPAGPHPRVPRGRPRTTRARSRRTSSSAGRTWARPASVYAFAYAPASLVKNYDATKSWPANGVVRAKAGAKDTPVACVLAQLNSSGQLVQVHALDASGLHLRRAHRAGPGGDRPQRRARGHDRGRHLLRGLRRERHLDVQRRHQPQRGDRAGQPGLQAAGAADRVVVEPGRGRARLLGGGAGQPHLLRGVPLRRLRALDLVRRHGLRVARRLRLQRRPAELPRAGRRSPAPIA